MKTMILVAAAMLALACGGPEAPVQGTPPDSRAVLTASSVQFTRTAIGIYPNVLVRFDTAEPDDAYTATARVIAFTGTPPAAALDVAWVSKASGDMVVGLMDAPGAGNTVTVEIVASGLRNGG